MADEKVERILINYKTLEDYKRFQADGTQELSMFEDLENDIVENDSDSPFYGIFYGNNLVARMSLYQRSKKYDDYFNPPQDYVVLFKLEVLPAYRTKGYGNLLVYYAKGFQQPLKTKSSTEPTSKQFWEKMVFVRASYNIERELGENPYIWMPEGVKQAVQPPQSASGDITTIKEKKKD